VRTEWAVACGLIRLHQRRHGQDLDFRNTPERSADWLRNALGDFFELEVDMIEFDDVAAGGDVTERPDPAGHELRDRDLPRRGPAAGADQGDRGRRWLQLGENRNDRRRHLHGVEFIAANTDRRRRSRSKPGGDQAAARSRADEGPRWRETGGGRNRRSRPTRDLDMLDGSTMVFITLRHGAGPDRAAPIIAQMRRTSAPARSVGTSRSASRARARRQVAEDGILSSAARFDHPESHPTTACSKVVRTTPTSPKR